jgi:hypothetical protein
MSANNGDRSRHNRLRRAKERRRVTLRALRVEMGIPTVAHQTSVALAKRAVAAKRTVKAAKPAVAVKEATPAVAAAKPAKAAAKPATKKA